MIVLLIGDWIVFLRKMIRMCVLVKRAAKRHGMKVRVRGLREIRVVRDSDPAGGEARMIMELTDERIDAVLDECSRRLGIERGTREFELLLWRRIIKLCAIAAEAKFSTPDDPGGIESGDNGTPNAA